MAKEVWKDAVIAESDDVVEVEGNMYFPPDSVKRQYLKDSSKHSQCPWKGEAHYYHLDVGGVVNEDAAWYYPHPKEAASHITGYVAFWKGVEVIH